MLDHLCKFGRGHYEEHNYEITLNLDQWKRYRLSYLELWRPFQSAQPNHLSYFGRRHYEEHFCGIILNLEHWLRGICHVKPSLIKNSGGPFVQLCLVGRGHYENSSVTSFSIWPSGLGDVL